MVGCYLQFEVMDAVEQCRHDWMRRALDQCITYLASGPSSTTPNSDACADFKPPV